MFISIIVSYLASSHPPPSTFTVLHGECVLSVLARHNFAWNGASSYSDWKRSKVTEIHLWLPYLT